VVCGNKDFNVSPMETDNGDEICADWEQLFAHICTDCGFTMIFNKE
jgi:hypothetical protein